ncbi:MAG: hypothetical protein HZC04_01545 [Candidatus Lloydbacteria bacterium]|nr:hypothetical protein [Candidatus Lloydbacteria bacterium]
MENVVLFNLLNFCFLIAAIVFTGMFGATIFSGKTMAGDDEMPESSRSCFKYWKQGHRQYANYTLLSLAAAVLFIEMKVRLGGFADRAPELFWAHLFFAIPFLCTLLLLRFKITGTKNLLLHKKIAHTSIALFIGTAITGSMLFFN